MSAYTDWPGEMLRVGLTDHYTATMPLPWDLGFKGSGLTVTVPAEFPHDVSVPALLRWAFDPHDRRYQRAARLHDWLLHKGWSRSEAAGVFNEALKADAVPFWRRLLMFLAVALWRYR